MPSRRATNDSEVMLWLVLDLESAVGLGIRRSIKAQQLPPTALDYLAPGPRVAYFFEPAPALEAA